MIIHKAIPDRFAKPALRLLCVLGAAAGLSAMAGAGYAQERELLWENVQKTGVLRCGAAVAPPYVIRDPKTGEYSGFFAELCRDFAEEVLKVKPEFVDTTWDSIVAGLQAGKWDLALALSRTPSRAMAINFSTAASQFELSLAYNKDNPKVPAGVTSVTEIDKPDVTFAVMSGTSTDKAISAAVKNGQILRLPTADETRLALVSRRADILVDAADTNWLFTRSNPDWAVAFNPSPALAKQGVGFGLRREVSSSDVDVLDIFIEEKVATGAVDLLIKEAVDKTLELEK